MEDELSAESLGKLAGVDEGLALVWLQTLEQAGHVKPEYRWYCPKSGELLLTTATVNEAPDDVECQPCASSHKAASECHVSIIFLPKTSTPARAAGNAEGAGDAAS